MSTSSKSPRDVLIEAYKVGRRALADYGHLFSPKKFTQPQLFACLVLKSFLKTDYRGVVAFLQDCPELSRAIGLEQIPHFTTLQKAGRRLLKLGNVQGLLAATLRAKGRRKKKVFAWPRSTQPDCNHVTAVRITSSGGRVSQIFIKPRLINDFPSSASSAIRKPTWCWTFMRREGLVPMSPSSSSLFCERADRCGSRRSLPTPDTTASRIMHSLAMNSQFKR